MVHRSYSQFNANAGSSSSAITRVGANVLSVHLTARTEGSIETLHRNPAALPQPVRHARPSAPAGDGGTGGIMKKYLLFTHNEYESASIEDFVGSFDTIEEAKNQPNLEVAYIVTIGENEFNIVSTYESRFMHNRGWVREWFDKKDEPS